MERVKGFTSRWGELLRIVICVILAVAVLFSAAFFARGADGLDSMDLPTVTEYDDQLAAQLREAGVEYLPEDYISFGPDGGAMELWVSRRNTVRIKVDNAEIVMLSNGERLSSLLERAGVSVDMDDVVITGRGTDDVDFRLTVVRSSVHDEYRQTKIPRTVVEVPDDTMFQGYSTIQQVGYDGLQRDTYRVTQLNDYTYETLIDSKVITVPQDQIVAVGTQEAPPLHWLSVSQDQIVSKTGDTITLTSGETLHYSRVLNVLATAYTTEGCTWKITATGTTARVGAIAVDPRVIPYGSKMYIVSSDGSIVYGIATAEDCGGLIKGNRIDVFYDTRSDCIQFGARNCVVYVLDE